MFCLFVCCFMFHLKIYHSNGNVTITCKWLQILIFTMHSWPLSIKGSLTCQTSCDKDMCLYGHLWGPQTFIPFAKGSTVEMSLPVLTTQVCCDRGSNPKISCKQAKCSKNWVIVPADISLLMTSSMWLLLTACCCYLTSKLWVVLL